MTGECAKKESAVLKRLGPVPFWRGERKCLDALGEMYSRAMESAAKMWYNVQHEKLHRQ